MNRVISLHYMMEILLIRNVDLDNKTHSVFINLNNWKNMTYLDVVLRQ